MNNGDGDSPRSLEFSRTGAVFMTGKHRRPRPTGRTLATAAAALTAGALPLAAAGTACAAAAPDPLSIAAPLTAGNPLADAGISAKAAELGGKVQELSAGAD